MSTAIEFNNISKQYRLGVVSSGTLHADLSRWWTMNILHKEDPFLKIGETNDRSSKGYSDFVWALRDIDFKVEQGDVVGIIGKNGAGKSTLLKILSKVTGPTTGTIRAKGRIGSLLEVGTGFHPEMTGRENIFMNGAILGMTKHEIAKKLDEIVDFSGCERYLDTPVKRYSSGMMVRLGFAVAAHLDPEILVVDEVLAVGDAEFQKKAIGKMQDVSKGEGRTVLFVSHNMSAVRSLCKSGIILDKGTVIKVGKSSECVDSYLEMNSNEKFISHSVISDDFRKEFRNMERELEYTDIRMQNDPDNMSSEEPISLVLSFRRNNFSIKECQFGISIENYQDEEVGLNFSEKIILPDDAINMQANIKFSNHQLARGKYRMVFSLCINDGVSSERTYDVVYYPISFEVKFMDSLHEKSIVNWTRHCNISYYPNKVELKKI